MLCSDTSLSLVITVTKLLLCSGRDGLAHMVNFWLCQKNSLSVCWKNFPSVSFILKIFSEEAQSCREGTLRKYKPSFLFPPPFLTQLSIVLVFWGCMLVYHALPTHCQLLCWGAGSLIPDLTLFCDT